MKNLRVHIYAGLLLAAANTAALAPAQPLNKYHGATAHRDRASSCQ